MENSSSLVSLRNGKKNAVLEILQFTVLISFLLYFGRTLFIPLSFAMLISLILYPICKWIEQKGISRSVAISITILFISVLIGVIVFLLFNQLIAFLNEWQTLKIKLIETNIQLSIFLTERLGISSERQLELVNNSMVKIDAQVLPVLQSTAYSISETIFFLILILVFSSLILYYRKLLSNAIYQLFPTSKKATVHEVLLGTIHAYYSFMKGMILVYLIVGILNSIGLAIIGVPHPVLFGFIASILTFIPYVGIMIASLLPIAVSWVEFNSIWYPLGVVLVFTIVQFLEAYVIFPLAVGGRLKINTLAIMIMIVVGGIFWGAAGMILFIPFISILKLIADRTESLKTISILLGS